ncbi:SDR family oxidoreductase [Fusobacterium polymorphum]|jgi:oxidoreductase, short chain dehydrogenase/reductase family protein|uniref:SDR family NAD(P)-dependent oxidoreductase n=1 Tax=Fusobacterium nucleatum subsp. polymorphum TaxID=76857 RepID=UPI00300B406D
MKSIIKRFFHKFCKKITKVEVSQIKYGNLLENKVILITGGTSGIGKALTKRCLEEGAKVIITGRKKETLKKIKEEFNSENLEILQWNISEIKMIEGKFKEVEDYFGEVDIIFNNAGIYIDKNYLEITEEEYNSIMDINTKSIFFTCQYFMKTLINQKRKGKIINTVSIRGQQGAYEPYGISKWGLWGLTRGLAKKGIENGIIINGIAPGITAPGIAGAEYRIDPKENAYYQNNGDNRVALSEEIAEIGIFLASNASNHIVGQVIVCDGGETLI